jgi:cytochrome d ubiquinol oxidase subunit II
VAELWFAIVALSFTAYVVLDGFDLGAGAVYPFVARSEPERRQVLAAIGPFWHGNEVWLLAAGGALFAAFPRVLASGLSGFYFAFFLVLWVLILRGISIKFRGEVNHPLWRTAWDVTFAGANLLLPVLFGAAFGNLVRGLPLDAEGWFSLPLFTDFTAKPPVGILDWYTVLAGLFALIAVAGHGATFLLWKSDGPVHERSRRAAQRLYGAVVLLWPLLTVITWLVDAPMLAALPGRPLAWLSLLLAVAGLVGVHRSLRRDRPLAAFLGSCAFLTGMLAATAACVFPVMLRAIDAGGVSLTAHNASVPASSLATALGWWVVGAPLAVLYFVLIFRLHRGKLAAAPGREGY